MAYNTGLTQHPSAMIPQPEPKDPRAHQRQSFAEPLEDYTAHLIPSYSPTEFMTNIWGSIQNMSGEQRNQFIANARRLLMERLQKYTRNLGRGRELEPNQQAEYDAVQANLNSLDKFTQDPSELMSYMSGNEPPSPFTPPQRYTRQIIPEQRSIPSQFTPNRMFG